MLLQIILLDVFVHAKQVCFKNYLSHPYFCWFMVRIIILHSQWKLLYSQWKVRDFFCSGGWQPCNEFNSVTRGSFHCSCSSGFSVHERVSMIMTIIYYSWIISHQTWIWLYYLLNVARTCGKLPGKSTSTFWRPSWMSGGTSQRLYQKQF